MQFVGAQGRLKRLVVVADNSLIVEAIALGLRKSGEFELVGPVGVGPGQVRAVIEAAADVVLVDEMERSDEDVALIGRIRAAQSDAAVIVLTSSMEAEWLDAIFNAGASGAISKSTHPAALATLLRETINGNIVHIHRSLRSSRGSTTSAVAEGDCQLTAREVEILRLVAHGSTNGDIAQKLSVTEQTVKFHLSNVYRKLNVTNRTEASRYAHLSGLVRIAQTSAPQRT